MNILFSDKAIDYETFITDLVARLSAALSQIRHAPEYISQRKAYSMFGRANVDRWRRQGKIQPSNDPNHTIPYSTAETASKNHTRLFPIGNNIRR